MKWSLTKTSTPENSLNSFKRDLDRVFDDFFSFKPSSLVRSEWLPELDVVEDEKAIHVKAEMPGMEEKDINVTLDNHVLTISGEKKEEKREEDKKKNYIYSERKYGCFSRSLSLPEGIKADKIRADFKKGVLSIEIPKDEAAQPKKIKVNIN